MLNLCSSIPLKLIISGVLTILLTWLYTTVKAKPRLKDFAAISIPAAIFIFAIVSLSCNVPYSDDYPAIISYVARDFPERVSSLLQLHNEHRIVTTRIITELQLFLLGHVNFQVYIAVANLMFAALLIFIYKRFKSSDATYLYVPFLWLSLDWFNWENPLWAMAGIQNIGVLLFAYLAFHFASNARRQSMTSFLLSHLFALLATITSGQGLLTWFCLVVIALKGVVVNKANRLFLLKKTTVVSICTLLCAALYFISFPQVVDSNPNHSIIYSLDFFISYCGGTWPIHYISLPIGFAVIAILTLVAWNFLKLKDDTTIGFSMFLSGTLFLGAISRSEPIGLALCFRYTIISTMLFGCVMLILHQTTPRISMIWKHRFATTLLAVAIFTNLSTCLLGFPIFEVRKNQLIKDISTFPQKSEKLFIGPFDRATAIRDLSTAINKKRYTPPSLAQPRQL